MKNTEPEYEDLLKENETLKLQLSEIKDFDLLSELKKKNVQLNEYNEELKQMLDTINEQKTALEKGESKFKILESNLSDIIWMMDLNGNFIYVSPSAEKLLGYSSDEFSKIHPRDLLNEESYKEHVKNLQNVIEKEEKGEITGNFSSLLQHIRKNGEMFWAEVSASPIRDSYNKITGLVGITRDITSRIKTEEEISKLKFAVDQSPASIVITNTKGNIEYVNSTFTKVTGYTFDEAVGKNPSILKSGKTPESEYKRLWTTITKGEIWRGEIINRKKNGENYWERIIIAPIKNNQDTIINYIAVKENITAQKIAERELIDSQKRYKLLSDISLEGIIIHENGLVQDINTSITRITGYTVDDVLNNLPVELLFTPESMEIIKQNIENGYELPYEVTGRKKDGSTYPAEIEGRQYNYKEREVRVAALRDITYRKRVDEVLRTSLKMNELLATHNEEQIIEWGLEEAVRLTNSHIGFFHFVNDDQNTISLHSWSKKTLENCHVPDKLEHYSISEAGTWVDSFYTKTAVIHNDYKNLSHKKGLPKGHFPLHRYISVPVVEDTKVVVIFGVGNKTEIYEQFDADLLSLFAKNIWMVIQRKRIEKELRESNAAKDKFFSIISHDLRSPIGSVHSLTDVLIESFDELSSEEMHHYLKTINATVEGVYNLLDNMLIWAQSHRNKIEYTPAIYQISHIIDKVIDIEKLEAEKKNISLHKKGDDRIQVWTDLNMLNTILRNLISNAIKFTNKGGNIDIIMSKYNDIAALVTVKDNGIGISPQSIKKIFNIDENFSTKGTANEKGTGLGLVLCKEFVERNGGKIWVESTVNAGTSFHFTLPIK